MVAPRAQPEDASNELRRKSAVAISETMRRLVEISEWRESKLDSLDAGLPEAHAAFAEWLSQVAARRWHHFVTDGERAAFFAEDATDAVRSPTDRLALFVDRAAVGSSREWLGSPEGFDPRRFYQKYIRECPAAVARMDLVDIGRRDGVPEALLPVVTSAIEDGLVAEFHRSARASRIDVLRRLTNDTARWLGVAEEVGQLQALAAELDETMTSAMSDVLQASGHRDDKARVAAGVSDALEEGRAIQQRLAGTAERILAGLRRKYAELGGALSEPSETVIGNRELFEAWGELAGDALLLYKVTETASEIPAELPLPHGVRAYLRVIPNGQRNMHSAVGVSATDLVNLVPRDGELVAVRRGSAALVLAVPDEDAQVDLLRRGALQGTGAADDPASQPEVERRLQLGLVTARVVWTLEDSHIDVPEPTAVRQLALGWLDGADALADLPWDVDVAALDEVLRGFGLPRYARVEAGRVELGRRPCLLFHLTVPALRQARTVNEVAIPIDEFAVRDGVRSMLREASRRVLGDAVVAIDRKERAGGVTLPFLPLLGNRSIRVQRLTVVSQNPPMLRGFGTTDGSPPVAVEFRAMFDGADLTAQDIRVPAPLATALAVDALSRFEDWDAPSDLDVLSGAVARSLLALDRSLVRAADEAERAVVQGMEDLGLSDIAAFVPGRFASRLRDRWGRGRVAGESVEAVAREVLWSVLAEQAMDDVARRGLQDLADRLLRSSRREELEEQWRDEAARGSTLLAQAVIHEYPGLLLQIRDEGLRGEVNGILNRGADALRAEIRRVLEGLDPESSPGAAGAALRDATLRCLQALVAAGLTRPQEGNRNAASARRLTQVSSFFSNLGENIATGGLGVAARDWFEEAVDGRRKLEPGISELLTEVPLAQSGLMDELAADPAVSGLQAFVSGVLRLPLSRVAVGDGDEEDPSEFQQQVGFLVRQATESARAVMVHVDSSRRRAIEQLCADLDLAPRFVMTALEGDLESAATTLGTTSAALAERLRETGLLGEEEAEAAVSRAIRGFRRRAEMVATRFDFVVDPVLSAVGDADLHAAAEACREAEASLRGRVEAADAKWCELQVTVDEGLDERVGRAALAAAHFLDAINSEDSTVVDSPATAKRFREAVEAIARARDFGGGESTELKEWAALVVRVQEAHDIGAVDQAAVQRLRDLRLQFQEQFGPYSDAVRSALSNPGEVALRIRALPASPVALPRDVEQMLRPLRLALDGRIEVGDVAELAVGMERVAAVREAVELAQAHLRAASQSIVEEVAAELTDGKEAVLAARDSLTEARNAVRQDLQRISTETDAAFAALERCSALLRGAEADALAGADEALGRLLRLVDDPLEQGSLSAEALVRELEVLAADRTGVLDRKLTGAANDAQSALREWARSTHAALSTPDVQATAEAATDAVRNAAAQLRSHKSALTGARDWVVERHRAVASLPTQVLSPATVEAFFRDVSELTEDPMGALRRHAQVQGDAAQEEIARREAALREWAEQTRNGLHDALDSSDLAASLEVARARLQELEAHANALTDAHQWVEQARDRLDSRVSDLRQLDLPIAEEEIAAWKRSLETLSSEAVAALVPDGGLESLADLEQQLEAWAGMVESGEATVRRQLRHESAALAAQLNVPAARFEQVEGEVKAYLGDLEASLGSYEELAQKRGREVRNLVQDRIEGELAPVLEAVSDARDQVEERAKSLLESEIEGLERDFSALVPDQIDLLGYRCDVRCELDGAGAEVIVSHGSTGSPDHFEIEGAFEVTLQDRKPELQFRQGARLPVPQLGRLMGGAFENLIPGLKLRGAPVLQDGRLHASVLYRPESFPFEVTAELDLDFQDLASPKVSVDFEQTVRSAVKAGLNALIGELLEAGELPGLGPVQIEDFRLLTLPRGFGVELEVSLTAYEPFKVPVIVRILPGAGLEVDVDERVFGSALSTAMNAWLGDSLPLGLRLDDPAFDLEDGLRVFVRYHVDIPIFGAGLGGRLTVSAEGIEMDSALTVKIPMWIDAPPVSFGEMAVTLDLRRKLVAVSGKVAISPGAATQYILCARITGELSIEPLELRSRGDLFLAGGLLSLAESEIVLRPTLGSFECTMSAGGFASDLLQLEGELLIEILDERMIKVDGGDANVLARASLDVLGMRLAEVEAGLNFDLALWAKVEADLPLAAAYARLAVEEGLRNPSLRFQARLGDEGDLGNIRVFVHADPRFVAADARAHALGTEVGVYLEFAGLGDLVPWRIIEELLSAIDLGLSPPKELSISLSNAEDGEDEKDNDEDPDSQAKNQPEVPPPPQPKPQGRWNPTWHFEVEEKKVKRKKGGFLGMIGNKEWTETIRIVHCRNVKPLRALFGLDGNPNKNRAAYYRQANGYMVVVDNRGAITIYGRGSGRWQKVWTGETSHHIQLEAEPLFVEDGLAFLRYTRGDVDLVLSLPEGSSHLAGELQQMEKDLRGSLVNCSDVLVGGKKVLDAVADGTALTIPGFRQQLWILARLRLNAIEVSTLESLGDSGVFYLSAPNGNFVCVRTERRDAAGGQPQAGPTILLRDWTGGRSVFSAPPPYLDCIESFAAGLRSIEASESRLALPAWGHLIAEGVEDDLGNLLVFRERGTRSGDVFLIPPTGPTVPGLYTFLASDPPFEGLVSWPRTTPSASAEKRLQERFLLNGWTHPNDSSADRVVRRDLFGLLSTQARPPLDLTISRANSDAGVRTRVALGFHHPKDGGAPALSYGLVAPTRNTDAKPWVESVEDLRTWFGNHTYYLPSEELPTLLDDRRKMLETLSRGDWLRRGWRINPAGRLPDEAP